MYRLFSLLALFALLVSGQIIIPDGTVPPFPSTLEPYPAYRSGLAPNNPNAKQPNLKWEDPLLHRRIKWVYDTVRSLGVNPTGYSINPRFSMAEGGVPREAMITWGAEYGASDIPILQFFLNPSVSAVILAGYSGKQFGTWPYYPVELETRDVSVQVPICEPWPEMARELYDDPKFDVNNVRKPCPGDTRPEGDIFPIQLSPGASISVFKKFRRPNAMGPKGGFAWTPDNPTSNTSGRMYWLNVGYGIEGRSRQPMAEPAYPEPQASVVAKPNSLRWANQPKAPKGGDFRSRVHNGYQVTEVYEAGARGKPGAWKILTAERVE